MNNDKIKCQRCKVMRPVKYFSKNRSDEYKKNCDECLEKFREWHKNNNVIKMNCPECEYKCGKNRH